MLKYELTPRHAGIVLWGDRPSFSKIYNLIHYVVEECGHIHEIEDFVLGLAYDVRKSLEKKRRLDSLSISDDLFQIYGFETLWPEILIQIGVLRHTMAYIPTTKLNQATMYELESVIEVAIHEAVPTEADSIIEQMYRIGNTPCSHLKNVINSRCRYFIELPPKKRLKKLPRLMETFSTSYEFLAETGHYPHSDSIQSSAFIESEKELPEIDW